MEDSVIRLASSALPSWPLDVGSAQGATTVMVSIDDIRMHQMLQPRVESIVPLKEMSHVQRSSSEHTDALAVKLKEDSTLELDPILLANVAGDDKLSEGLYVVDGHHRLAAYVLAGRKQITCRVQAMSRQEALLVSKIANCSFRSLRMHEEQRRDAAWQTLILLSDGGRIDLPRSASTRKLAATFSVSKNTIQRMIQRLRTLDPAQYGPGLLADETGWPRWQSVREHKNPWNYALQQDANEAADAEARRLLSKLCDLFSSSSVGAQTRVVELLRRNRELSDGGHEDSLDMLADLLEQISAPSP